jgi:hypothetical protein
MPPRSIGVKLARLKKACRDWLDSLPASVPLPPRFCPNADIFFELQVDRPGPDHPVTKNSPRK